MALQSVLLPDELLLMIFSSLPLQDIKSLRLVSRHFHSCSSQFLFWSLNITSAERSLHFYKEISSDSLFRRGISKIVYNTRLSSPSPGEHDELLPHEQHEGLRSPAPDAFDQCCKVYDLLCDGIPHLPMLREITITDRILEPSPNPSVAKHFIDSTDTNQRRIRNGELGLFILLRALSEVQCRPRTFRISLQSFIAGIPSAPAPQAATTIENHYGIGYGSRYSPTLFDRWLTTAPSIFQDLHHLSIITQSTDYHTGIESSSSFICNLCAFISTAGQHLYILEVAIQETLPPEVRLDTMLFSTSLFSLTPTAFPFLRKLMLKGVPMEGFALIAFLSRQLALKELLLQEVRLTRGSPDWVAIVDDLGLLLGVQFEGGKSKRTRSGKPRRKKKKNEIKDAVPMERISLELERCFEPGDGPGGREVSIGSRDLRRFFKGREDNPLRTCYESFVRVAVL